MMYSVFQAHMPKLFHLRVAINDAVVIPMERAIMSLSGLGVSFMPSTIFLMGLSVCLAMYDAGMTPHDCCDLATLQFWRCFADNNDFFVVSPARFRCWTPSLQQSKLYSWIGLYLRECSRILYQYYLSRRHRAADRGGRSV